MKRVKPNPSDQTEQLNGGGPGTLSVYKKKLRKEMDKILDERIEGLALERIKTWDESKAISHEELKARLGISD